MKSPLLTIIIFVFTVQYSLAQNKAVPSSAPKFPDASQFQQSTITYKIIDAEGNTYGYNIYTDGQLMIHQPSKPGMSGNRGFDTKEAASKVAALVISKIKKGEMPPTVTKEEMERIEKDKN